MREIITLEDDCIAVYTDLEEGAKLCCKEGNFEDMLEYVKSEFPEALILDRRIKPYIIDWDLRLTVLCLIEEE